MGTASLAQRTMAREPTPKATWKIRFEELASVLADNVINVATFHTT